MERRNCLFNDNKRYRISECSLPDVRKKLYHYYAQAGYKVKTYDFSTVYSTNGKRRLRSFEIEDLIFRTPIVISNPKLKVYYHDKIILVTGGGSSFRRNESTQCDARCQHLKTFKENDNGNKAL
jgi:FlaA1/EpsC-like NDP-sugar epimerase